LIDEDRSLAVQEGRTMYVPQRDALLQSADLALDGGEPAEASAERIRKALAERGVAGEA
jgi:hypothetical protein